jgi:hypothetical protein
MGFYTSDSCPSFMPIVSQQDFAEAIFSKKAVERRGPSTSTTPKGAEPEE